MTIQKLFIANLKEYRKFRKISQMQLAERCNSAQTYIAEIEIGKKFPSPDMIERIAKALDIESYCLFKNEPVNEEQQLPPSKKQELTDRIHKAVLKIVNQY
ncbi:MAG: helix-turn-helix transcriptional regulator [Spirochaetaceae bacterium]|jgi:transcriptional regulator with XRE-family HTH domain|nr:helix-turn-helix transcriptional regulator [Spirochaetaceae bacterium]